MKILLAVNGADTEAWLFALKASMPTADIRVWHAGDTAPADYILYWKVHADALSPRAGVKAIFNLGAGIDAIVKLVHDNPGTLARQVPVIRLEDAGMAQQMAQYAVYCALRYQRRFDEYEDIVRKGSWQPMDAHPIEAFTVGVLGAGQLGKPVALALLGMGFPVRIYSRSEKTIPGVEGYAGAHNLDAFARGVRMLVNLLPNTPETLGILSGRLFRQMARGSYVVNLARGSHLVERDVINALNDGTLSRVALDVFQEEPLPPNHVFWKHPGVELTPHIAARTLVRESVAQIVEKIARHQRGEQFTGLDFARGY